MAVLNLPEVMEILQTGKVPVDVCCATLNAFMKRSVPDYYFYTTLPTEAEKVYISLTFKILYKMGTMQSYWCAVCQRKLHETDGILHCCLKYTIWI